MAEKTSSARWVRTAVDYGCPVAFLAVILITHNFQLATWVLVATSAVALAVGFAVERRIPPVPLLAGSAALIFGTLTLVFHDKTFVKMKLTFVDATLGAVLLGGLLFKRLPIKGVIGEAIRLPDHAWRGLSIRYGLFFLVCAAANEAVWRTQTDARWAMFRIGLLVAAVLFSLAQTPYLMKHMADPQEAGPPDPADPGF